ncbi:MAG: hypothetical protein U0169_26140 [Polyangiaceae bacterium]
MANAPPTAATVASAEAAPDASAEAASPAPDAGPPADAGPKRPELPRGGRELFPTHRLVGYCGTPGAPALGPLLGNLAKKTKALEAQAAPYAEDRTLLPVFELIAVVVQSYEGADKKHRRRVDSTVVDAYLEAARAAKGLLLLNIQPGQSDFLTEVKVFEKYLREPDVGVALDPEWAMPKGVKPGKYYGHTKGPVLEEVASYLEGLVREGDLPEKALVFHQVEASVVREEAALTAHPGIVWIKSVDGLGPKHTKITTYNLLMKTTNPVVHAGFKLFYEEDKSNGGRLMKPTEVLALTPKPEYVMYE